MDFGRRALRLFFDAPDDLRDAVSPGGVAIPATAASDDLLEVLGGMVAPVFVGATLPFEAFLASSLLKPDDSAAFRKGDTGK